MVPLPIIRGFGRVRSCMCPGTFTGIRCLTVRHFSSRADSLWKPCGIGFDTVFTSTMVGANDLLPNHLYRLTVVAERAPSEDTMRALFITRANPVLQVRYLERIFYKYPCLATFSFCFPLEQTFIGARRFVSILT